jgi:hypothetical protein
MLRRGVFMRRVVVGLAVRCEGMRASTLRLADAFWHPGGEYQDAKVRKSVLALESD